jgi:FkbM family methyltransferase
MIKKNIQNWLKKKQIYFYKPGVTDSISINYRKIFTHFKVKVLIDVGANEGQYALAMQKLGFSEKIISIEPLKQTYDKLYQLAKDNKNWTTLNIALGDMDGEKSINVSKNTVSSSFLDMLPEHLKQEPDSVYQSKERIIVKKLDSIFGNNIETISSVYLKLDVQGFEKNVIEGASGSLKNISLIQMEMALVPLYKGELLLADMIQFMSDKGFVLYHLIPGFRNYETGQQFQTDGIFVRKDLI